MKSVFSPEYDVFRRCMIVARKRADMTQATLAHAIGKPQSFVAKYEKGERRLDVIEFLRITHILGIDSCKILREVEQSFGSTSCEDQV